MRNFADQCLDMAQSILSQNLNSINEDGSINPVEGEKGRKNEPGHVALAIGEYYRATQQLFIGGFDLVDAAARTITAQVFGDEKAENGLAYSALGLLSFGPAKDRNRVWERLLDPTRKNLDRCLLARSDYDNHFQAFNIAKAVARYSMGLSKKDETGKLIDRFIHRLESASSIGFFDDYPSGLGGTFDIYGVKSFIFIRQALQLHANLTIRERKLPSLRTYSEKYLRILPDIVRQDGMGWCCGRGVGAYGQMYCISMILQSMRDGWIAEAQLALYIDLLRRLFHFFFATYLDQEHGYLVIRDEERSMSVGYTTRMANFDAARYLSQWSRLASDIGGNMASIRQVPRRRGRFVFFDKTQRKEQGLFLYEDPASRLHVQIPLTSSGEERGTSNSLAFPHCPGVFDCPVNRYLPIMQPELQFKDNVIIPSFYGKRCVTGLGSRNSFYFRYEQPELITKEGRIVPGLGSCKVSWTFLGNKVTSEFSFLVKRQVQLNRLRYYLAVSLPHSKYRLGATLALGEEGLRAVVVYDDFQTTWAEPEIVLDDPKYQTYYGNIHYLQLLSREYPLVMQPGQPYRLSVAFEPQIVFAD